jgi:WhiB family redox-sensing transcriptional regulator
MDTSADTKWMARGLCADQPPSLFFPSDGVGVEVAKRICEECPVRATCLEYAIENRIDHGVWGGTSERQRRRIIKARAADDRGARTLSTTASTHERDSAFVSS